MMGKQELQGKTAIITGSGSGIGRAIAINLGRRGARIMLNGRTEEKLISTKYLLQSEGIDVAYFVGDVSNFESCKELVDKCLQHFGRLDIVVPNGSESMQAMFAEMNAEVFERVFKSNSLGAVFPVKAAIDHVIKNKGSIVLINSLAGLYGVPSGTAYAAGKRSLTAFAQGLRIELNDAGVHVGMVYVGFTQNDPDKKVLNDKGALVPVAERKGTLQQTQEQVAEAVAQIILKRKYQAVLSPLGKIMYFSAAVWPGFIRWVLERNFKKQKQLFIKES